MSNKQRCLAYLQHYEQKNLAGVAAMFADDIVLRDWKLIAHGKAAALDEIARNFAAARTIEIHPLGLYEDHDTVAAELRILIDGAITLHVMDVIRFDEMGMIQAIRAYLGKGDA